MKLLIVLLLAFAIYTKMKHTNGAQITAVEDADNLLAFYPQQYFKRILSFESPGQRCNPEDCEFCCLSITHCGTKEQCETSEYTSNVFKILFLCVCSVLISFLVYKIYITNPEPEHTDDDKIDEKSLNMLIGLFMHNRENRKKFKI
jgi:hypothetical protein